MNSDLIHSPNGYVELQGWNFVCLTGKDRARLLHNFCTANINQLPSGSCTEAFILNDKGKVLWFGWVLALPDQLVLCGAGPFGGRIASHLERYVIREDVQVYDRSNNWQGWFLIGEHVRDELQSAAEGSQAIAALENKRCSVLEINSVPIQLANIEIGARGYMMLASHEHRAVIEDWLSRSKCARLDQATLQGMRILNRVPWYGIDIDESNLPQEVNRDEQAISFTKGCYLGQETVARLDALGHVNQLLVGLEFQSAERPSAGMVVEQNGRKVLRVTSVAQVDSRYIGLGYVRREFCEAGNVIDYPQGQIRIRD